METINNITIGQIAVFLTGLLGLIAVFKSAINQVKDWGKELTKPLDDIKADISSLKKDMAEQTKLNNTALKCLLRKQLLHEFEVMLERGYATMAEQKELAETYQIYKDLEGNGLVTKEYQKVLDLPTQKGDNDD